MTDVAVKAIFEKGHQRQSYSLLGPNAITDDTVATLLSETLGTVITYVDKPLDFFKDKNTAALEQVKATGIEESFPKGDIKKVLGRHAETFEDYLKATELVCPIEQTALASAIPAEQTETLPTEMGNEKEMTTAVTPDHTKPPVVAQ